MRSVLARVVVRCFPGEFRARHGDELMRVVTEQERRARTEGRLWRFRLGSLFDALRNGFALRAEERFRRGTGGPAGDRDPDRGIEIMARIRRHHGRRRGGGMDDIRRDLVHAARSLRKSPGFTAVAVLTIAVGIGASTALFSVVDGVLLEPLPYEDGHELVMVWGEMRERDVTHFPTSPPDFQDLRTQSELLDDVAGVFTYQQPLLVDGEASQLDVAGVTPNFFDLLGVRAQTGRTFVEADGLPDGPDVQPGDAGALPAMVLLTHGTWLQRFGSDPDVVGRTVDLGGQSGEIVGVLPADFRLLMPPEAALIPDPELFVAARLDYANAPRNNVFLRPVARLADGVSLARAQDEVDRIAAGIAELSEVGRTAGYGIRLAPLRRDLTAQVRPVLSALMGAVIFVLLIACANVANLLLVRSSGRRREMAVRGALGAERARLVRQLLMESGLLAGAGAAVGVGLAVVGVTWLPRLQPGNLPRMDAVSMDGSVLAFTLGAAVFAALLFGTLPALHGTRLDLASALKERSDTDRSHRGRGLRRAVVVVEVALSLVLLVGTGLMIRSFVHLAQADPGFRADGLLAMEVAIPAARYPAPGDREQLLLQLQDRLSAIPGVTGASGAFPLPLAGTLLNGRYGTEEALTDPSAFRQATYRFVRPGYFEVMGTEVIEGRALTRADHADSSAVAVVDELLAARLWPGQSAVGRQVWVRVSTPEAVPVEVVGVVGHQRSETLAADGLETIYFADRLLGSFAASWVLRVQGDPGPAAQAVRGAVREIDPSLPVADVRPFTQDVAESMGPTRFALTLVGLFGAVALLLAVVGLYGVLSGLVRARTPEIGVRVAFGAGRGAIRSMVLRDGLGLAAVGVIVGLLAATLLTRVMERLLVGVSPTDPLTFAAVAVGFMAVAALACWVPVRRALRVDPLVALRDE